MATNKYQNLSPDGNDEEINFLIEVIITTRFKTTFKSALQKSAILRIVKSKFLQFRFFKILNITLKHTFIF